MHVEQRTSEEWRVNPVLMLHRVTTADLASPETGVSLDLR